MRLAIESIDPSTSVSFASTEIRIDVSSVTNIVSPVAIGASFTQESMSVIAPVADIAELVSTLV